MVAAASGPVARTAFREDRMSDEKTILSGPDLAQGVALSAIPDKTMLLGHAHGEQVLLVRRGHELFAIGATCTHYGAPLGDGLLIDDTIRCPWHHACFSLRTGEVLRAPALDPISRWRVEEVRDATGSLTRGQSRPDMVYRSEERRVGTKCGSTGSLRWSPTTEKKK